MSKNSKEIVLDVKIQQQIDKLRNEGIVIEIERSEEHNATWVAIYTKNEEELERVFASERSLREHNIYFDTGMLFGSVRDWSIDD